MHQRGWWATKNAATCCSSSMGSSARVAKTNRYCGWVLARTCNSRPSCPLAPVTRMVGLSMVIFKSIPALVEAWQLEVFCRDDGLVRRDSPVDVQFWVVIADT